MNMKRAFALLSAVSIIAFVSCIQKPEEGPKDPDEEEIVEVLDSTITHNLANGDDLLAGMPKLPAEVYSPSKLKTVYYPILVNRAVGSTANAASVVWRPEKTRVLYNIANFTPDTTSASYFKKIDKYGGIPLHRFHQDICIPGFWLHPQYLIDGGI